MSTINVNAINNVDVQNLASKIARAWVNFNGTGVVAIRKAFNVSSITDNGTGDFTVNFATPLPDANYAVGGAVQREVDTAPGIQTPSVFATTSYRFTVRDVSNGLRDGVYNSIIVFG